MAQYDTTTADVANSIGSAYSDNLKNAVQSLLGQLGENITADKPATAVEALNSTADALFLNLGEGERGSADAPLQFNDSGRENGRVYVFEGDEGYVAEFNTVERVIIGANGDDHFTILGDKNTTVEGGAGNDTIVSGSGDDSISGGAGNDSIVSGGGNDSIYGGAGNDEAVFQGAKAGYSVEQNGAITLVTNTSTGEVSQLVNVEKISFDDGSMAVEHSADVQALVTLYKQIFADITPARNDGQADLDGLQYWASQAEGGASLGHIALSMLNSDEAGNKLAQLDLQSEAGLTQAIELLYSDLLGRDADTAGVDYWKGQVEQGMSLADVASAFVTSQEMQGLAPTATDWDFLI